MNLSAAISLYAGGIGSGCQGPNCGRHFHGTTPEDGMKIWKQGFKKGGYTSKQKSWGHAYGDAISQDRKADGYAVVEMEAPNSEMFKADPEHSDDDEAFYTTQDIPKENIRSIEVYRGGKMIQRGVRK